MAEFWSGVLTVLLHLQSSPQNCTALTSLANFVCVCDFCLSRELTRVDQTALAVAENTVWSWHSVCHMNSIFHLIIYANGGFHVWLFCSVDFEFWVTSRLNSLISEIREWLGRANGCFCDLSVNHLDETVPFALFPYLIFWHLMPHRSGITLRSFPFLCREVKPTPPHTVGSPGLGGNTSTTLMLPNGCHLCGFMNPTAPK